MGRRLLHEHSIPSHIPLRSYLTRMSAHCSSIDRWNQVWQRRSLLSLDTLIHKQIHITIEQLDED